MEPKTPSDFQPVSFGKYLLLQKIGSGGMAEIYRAKTFGPHGFVKECAIKKILPHLIDDEEFMQMFIDEARIAVNLSHGNIVQVLDLGAVDRQAFIAMEYVRGKDLLELLARCAALRIRPPLKLALFVVMRMLKGLEFAHSARDSQGQPLEIIHRDVSPCNILLSYGGEVKIGDFGVARARNQRSRTEHGTLKGKVGYMSPEQVNGDPVDRRSDVFSVGIVLFELLAMQRLFVGSNDLNVMLKIRDGDIKEELSRLDFLPDALGALVNKALAHRPHQRFESAREFHKALLNFVFSNDIRVTEEDLGRFMLRIFAKEVALQGELTKLDPDDSTAFLALQSPQVARWRFREPNGSIVGPMSLETLMSILRYRRGERGNAVSEDHGPWRPPLEVPRIMTFFQTMVRKEGGIVSSHHLGMKARSSLASEVPARISVGMGSRSHLPMGSMAEPVIEGALIDTPLPQILNQLYTQRASGLLSVSNDGIQKDIYIEKGAPGYVASNKMDELLGNFLCDSGVITADQLQLALNRLSEFGGRLGDVLVQLKMLPETELFHFLSLQTRQKLLEVFAWQGGVFTYQKDRFHELGSYPLGIAPLEIIVQGIRSRYPVKTVMAYFAGRKDLPIALSEKGATNLDGLNLSAKELSVAATIGGGSTIARLVELHGSSSRVHEDDVWRVLFILSCTGLLQFEGSVRLKKPDFVVEEGP